MKIKSIKKAVNAVFARENVSASQRVATLSILHDIPRAIQKQLEGQPIAEEAKVIDFSEAGYNLFLQKKAQNAEELIEETKRDVMDRENALGVPRYLREENHVSPPKINLKRLFGALSGLGKHLDNSAEKKILKRLNDLEDGYNQQTGYDFRDLGR